MSANSSEVKTLVTDPISKIVSPSTRAGIAVGELSIGNYTAAIGFDETNHNADRLLLLINALDEDLADFFAAKNHKIEYPASHTEPKVNFRLVIRSMKTKNKDDTCCSAEIPRGLTVGEVAARSGVAVSALHFYESKGLIKSRRNSGNQRRYSRDVLRRIAVIKVAQRTGIPLEAIHKALKTLPGERVPTAQDWKNLSAAWRADLDDRIARLTRLRNQLDGCIGCGCLSLGICPLRNPGDRLAAQGAGPRLLDPDGIL